MKVERGQATLPDLETFKLDLNCAMIESFSHGIFENIKHQFEILKHQRQLCNHSTMKASQVGKGGLPPLDVR